MSMKKEEIISLIRKSIPDAKIKLEELKDDGDHYKAMIKSKTFNGKSKLEQHKMVYKSLKGKMGNELHALMLNTMEDE
ncbi:MAG: hypothetical protein CFH19_00893 [Alphaproteobacteria bacterium MarineAlpha5_Bin9]|nr:MAG: hypothetical protein CFH19_00893 [Alphaproteobacteria bacterium MarineAlpha5_Bin9]|tara:strand:- start:19729 stop:19962 length:234 start_codon:yes stop_codon:yes gene_type:complete